MINNNNFISIQGWMVNDLQLSGTDLLVYAIIYGFSQDGESVFSGTLQYLQNWTGASKRTVMRSLQELCERGLIEKSNRTGMSNVYMVTSAEKSSEQKTEPVSECHPCQNVTRDKLSGGGGQNVIGTPDKMSPDNIDNNIYINNIYNNTRAREKKAKTQKHKYGEFKNVLLTDNELDKLKQKFPNDWKERIEDLSYWLESKGKNCKSCYATILNWDRRDQKKKKENLPFTDAAVRPEYDDTVFDRILEQMGGDKE